MDGLDRTDRTGPPQIRTPSPSHRGIISRTQLRSLARTHARTHRNRNRNRNRFPGSGVGLTSLSSPPTSDRISISICISISTRISISICDSRNTRKTHTNRKAAGPKTPGRKTTLQQRKTRTRHTREHGTDIEKRSVSQGDHNSPIRIAKARTFNRDLRTDDDGRTDDDPHMFVRRTLAT